MNSALTTIILDAATGLGVTIVATTGGCSGDEPKIPPEWRLYAP